MEWTTVGNAPVAGRVEGSAVAGDKLYALGFGGTFRLYEYDPVTNGWTRKADLPASFSRGGASSLNGKVYAVSGGSDARMRTYDPFKDSWTFGSSLPRPRDYFSVAATGGRIFVIGGESAGGSVQPFVDAYDASADAWSVRTDMPLARYSAAVAVLDGRIYVAGGRMAGGVHVDTLQVYDPSTDAWTALAGMPTRRFSALGAFFGGGIYVLGGNTFGPSGPDSLDTVEAYDPAGGVWESKNPLPAARAEAGGGVVKGRVYVFGGAMAGGTVDLSSVEEGVPICATWTPTGTPTATPTATATPTPTPSCAPTGTPYCSDKCLPCPTIRPFCYAVACGLCLPNARCEPGEVRLCPTWPPWQCCSCATPTPRPPAPTETPTLTPTATPTETTPPGTVVAVDLGRGVGRPGGIACVAVTLSANGNLVAATSNDIDFDPSLFSFDDCVINPAIGPGSVPEKQCLHAALAADTERVAVLGTANVNPIPGGLLYTAQFGVDSTASPGSYPLSNTAGASDPAGNDLPATGMPGEILVTTCTGDCNGDGRVTIGEVIRVVNLFLGRPLCNVADAARNCPVADANGGGAISIGEIVQTVNRLLYGCPAEVTPTPTNTATSTPTFGETEAPTPTPSAGALCGGFPGIPCPHGEFCELPTGYCCCDFYGQCVPVPFLCPHYWAPVCGCDRVTYPNDCERRAARMSKACDGPCPCMAPYDEKSS